MYLSRREFHNFGATVAEPPSEIATHLTMDGKDTQHGGFEEDRCVQLGLYGRKLPTSILIADPSELEKLCPLVLIGPEAIASSVNGMAHSKLPASVSVVAAELLHAI